MTDEKIADVVTYVRQSWTNDAAPVTAAQVKQVRDKYQSQATMWTAKDLGR